MSCGPKAEPREADGPSWRLERLVCLLPPYQLPDASPPHRGGLREPLNLHFTTCKRPTLHWSTFEALSRCYLFRGFSKPQNMSSTTNIYLELVEPTKYYYPNKVSLNSSYKQRISNSILYFFHYSPQNFRMLPNRHKAFSKVLKSIVMQII